MPAIRTRKRRIAPRSAAQAAYVKALREHELVFGLGPAGTGKTYLAVAAAVDLLMTGEVERIILSRPAVEAGERLGFLPGDLREKVDPYLRPLYDALNDMLPAEQVQKRLGTGEIEVAPLAFMRGRTLSHAFVILDEAQNTTPVQMKMFLTRLGEGSRMVVTGDPTQIDLPAGSRSGLADALETLRGVEDIALVRFTEGRGAPPAGGAHRRRLRGARPRQRAATRSRGETRRHERDDPHLASRYRFITMSWLAAVSRCRPCAPRRPRARCSPARPANVVASVILTDDAEQRRSTAVIAARTRRPMCCPFAAAPIRRGAPPGAPVLLGDVVLAYETVAREAAEQRQAARRPSRASRRARRAASAGLRP